MPVQNMSWASRWAYNGASASMQINFAPQLAVAQASLSGANGEGLCMGGIKQYRTRTMPTGPDQDHNFTWNSNFGYPPTAFAPIMTSVTAELVVGGNGQQGVMTLLVWLWG